MPSGNLASATAPNLDNSAGDADVEDETEADPGAAVSFARMLRKPSSSSKAPAAQSTEPQTKVHICFICSETKVGLGLDVSFCHLAAQPFRLDSHHPKQDKTGSVTQYMGTIEIEVDSNLLLTAKQKFSFRMRPMH